MTVPLRADRDPKFAELDVVRLRSMVFTEDGALPAGTIGAIVHSHRSGEAYEVEFVEPVAVTVTLRGADLTLAA